MTGLPVDTTTQRVGALRITPTTVLLAAAFILGFFVLLMPPPAQQRGPALDSRSMALDGAGGLYRTLARLGFPVQSGRDRLSGHLSPNATYVVLAPAIPLTAEETSSILAAVRGGATLVFTPGRGALTDSLQFIADYASSLHTIRDTRVIGGPVPRIASPYTPVPLNESVAIDDSAVAVRSTAFMWYASEDSTARDVDAIVLGRTFGRGHAIAIAPALVLTNQLLRTGPPAIAIVRALEWANGDLRRPIIFDEYHHGAGIHADPFGTVVYALTSTAPGRAALMALVAALILLVSAAWRPLAPVHVSTVQRRSPLEHVQALARAYLQTGADKLGAERLVRGLRRRHALGLPRGVGDRVYLEAVRSRVPHTAADVSLVIAALERADSAGRGAVHGDSARIVPVRDAIARIEQALREQTLRAA